MSKRIAVFASGRGSNLAAILAAFPTGHPLGEVALVISNKPDAYALERARLAGIEAVYIPWKKGGQAAFEAQAQQLLQDKGIAVLVLAGFMRLLSGDFVDPWRGKILNIHPSLLPLFPGLDAQHQAVDAGHTETGCTVHFVDAGLDSGDVILQKRIPILPQDSYEAVCERLLPVEHEAYPQGLALVLLGLGIPAPTEAEGIAMFGAEFASVYAYWQAQQWLVAQRQSAVRVAQLLQTWSCSADVLPALRAETTASAHLALAQATDQIRMAFSQLTPLSERLAQWQSREQLIQRAQTLNMAEQVSAALESTAMIWEQLRA